MDYASIPIPLVVTMYSIIVAMLIMKSNHGNAIMGATHPSSEHKDICTIMLFYKLYLNSFADWTYQQELFQ